jgi:hypothetical protein
MQDIGVVSLARFGEDTSAFLYRCLPRYSLRVSPSVVIFLTFPDTLAVPVGIVKLLVSKVSQRKSHYH